jgi:preprotein translocase subunit SecE
MGTKKTYKYYLKIYASAIAAILLFTIIDWINNKEIDLTLLYSALVFPFLFVGMLFIFDKLFDWGFKKFSPKRQERMKNKENSYESFLTKVDQILNKHESFSIEDIRQLQEGPKFQKTLSQLHKIIMHGETQDLSFDYLGRKFKKNTVEYRAVQLIIENITK